MLFEEFEPLFVDAVKRQERKTKRAGHAVIGSLKLTRDQLYTVYNMANAWYTGSDETTKADAAKWAANALDDLAEKALYDDFFNLCPNASESDWNEHKADVYLDAVKDRLTEWRDDLERQIRRARYILNSLTAAQSWADAALKN